MSPAAEPLPIPVHVGSEPTDWWDDIEKRQHAAGEDAAPWLRDKQRPSLADVSLDWAAAGFEPRWVGFNSTDCAAALAPSPFSGHGADEFNRFRRGAAGRGETAVVISPIGKPGSSSSGYNVFGHNDSLTLGEHLSSISSRTIGHGTRVRIANGLAGADAQLALRLASCNPPLLWRALSLSGMTLSGADGTTHHDAQGTLVPILVTELEEPVAAVWLSPDGVERRYMVPSETPWPLLLTWLLEQALPEHAPGALRRSRRQLAQDPLLMSKRESQAHADLETLDRDYAERRSSLEEELNRAQGEAQHVRDNLLFGTGRDLVDAVFSALDAAGVQVLDVDDLLAGTKNADLLCGYEGSWRLVEVKSASGNAPERAYEDLMRHLREWPHLSGSRPMDGGALVLNHQIRTDPQRRTPPYGRPEFLAAQSEPVVTTVDLFNAWRLEDHVTVRKLLFGDRVLDGAAADNAETNPPEEEASSSAADELPSRRRFWTRRT